MEQCLGVQVPRGDNLLRLRVRQPVHFKGLGLRSHAEMAPMALMGALEQALPHFVVPGFMPGEVGGLLPDLRPLLGGASFGPHAVLDQWQKLLEAGARYTQGGPAGSRTGHELRWVFHRFQDMVQRGRQSVKYR